MKNYIRGRPDQRPKSKNSEEYIVGVAEEERISLCPINAHLTRFFHYRHARI